MAIETYNKFQYSVFVHKPGEGQWVVRADTIEEVAKAKADIEAFMKGLTPPSVETPVKSPTMPLEETLPINTTTNPFEEDPHMCPIHNISMKKRYRRGDSEEQKSQFWFDHRMKDEETGIWSTCSGKGYKKQFK